MTLFLDTNGLLYAATSGATDGDKPDRARAILRAGGFALSAQVLAEFYVNAARKVTPPLAHEQAMGWIERLRRFPVVPVAAGLVARGAALAERHRLSYWDGAIVAAAQEAGAEMLLTEDLGAGHRYGDVLVVNPFAS